MRGMPASLAAAPDDSLPISKSLTASAIWIFRPSSSGSSFRARRPRRGRRTPSRPSPSLPRGWQTYQTELSTHIAVVVGSSMGGGVVFFQAFQMKLNCFLHQLCRLLCSFAGCDRAGKVGAVCRAISLALLDDDCISLSGHLRSPLGPPALICFSGFWGAGPDTAYL